ncbi:MAG TPA: YlbF family regulator [Firmicutes bacterium]|nr:YlbF family regulator [Bacillota bacterium]
MNPYDAARQLTRALQNSPELKEYSEAQKLIAEDSAAREMLIDFRKEQFRLQKQELAGLEVAPEQREKLEKLFEVLNLNLTVKRFLDAEFRFSRLMGDIQGIIGEATADLIDPTLLQKFSEALSDEDDEADNEG